MSQTTDSQKPIEELESAVLGALELYFEALRREIENSRLKVGPRIEEYEEARRQLAEAEARLEELRYATAELQSEAVDTILGSSGASEIAEEVAELRHDTRDLAEAEKAALERKEEAEERLRQLKVNFDEDLGEAADGLAALAVRKAEEIDAFKGRLDQQFAEGRTSVLGAAN